MDKESESQDEQLQISDKVEILSTDDQKIKAIGEILSADSSRLILKLLFNNSLTANQIAQKTGISLPLVIYHLKKMQEASVVKITNVGKNVKSHDMKFYTIDKLAIVILPTEMSTQAKKSKSLFQSFSRIHRLATLGGVSIAAWITTSVFQKMSQPSTSLEMSSEISMDAPAMKMIPQEGAEEAVSSASQPVPQETIQSVTVGEPLTDFAIPVIVVLAIVISWLIIELKIQSKKKAMESKNK